MVNSGMPARSEARLNDMLGRRDEQPVRHDPLLEALERINCGAVVLDASRNALQINSTALRLLQQETGSPSRPAGDLEWVHGAITQLLNRAETRLLMSEEAW